MTKVEDGDIIVAACKDDCVNKLSFKAKKFFYSMMSDKSEIWDLRYR